MAFDIKTQVTLECPGCRSYKTVPRTPELPAEVRLIEIICPECDDGDRHSETWFSAPGIEVSQDAERREVERLSTLIARLQSWSLATGDFHGDRQLADEVLIADGWKCEPDPSFEGGVRWFIGPYSAGEASRPHPVNDLNTAIGVVPRGCNWRLTVIGERAIAHVWKADEIFRDEFEGWSERPSVALLIAALKYAQSATGGSCVS